MRGESRSGSRSPSDFNSNRGDRAERNDKGFNDSPPSNRVYACFLPEDIEENQLQEVFEECGTVSKIFMKKKEDGFTFAYITYQDINEARNAVEKLNRRKIGDKSIKVVFSRERSESRDNEGGRGGDRDQGRGGRGGFQQRDSDTRRKFDDNGDRGRGRPRESFENGGNRDRGFNQGEKRGPMKCFKCQEEGHISKNCPREGGNDGRQREQGQWDQGQRSRGDYKPKPKMEKMSEDECDY